jgi:2-methylcitrate dehydratase PrpD
MELAEFLTGQSFEDLPPQAITYAEMLIASTVASAALGSTLGSSRIIRALDVERGGTPQATVWFGAAEKLPVAAVARVNALMSDAAASDDSDLRNIVHQGTTACATALAVAEMTGASGRDIVTAIVLGYEAAGRMSTALQCDFHAKGFHGCIVASFAATVAAARLLRLTSTQLAQAIAITATSVGGLGAAANTSQAREYHAGQAAMLGVQAAQAAALGFRAETRILEMRAGFFDTFGDHADPTAVTRDIGTQWSILTDLGIKLVPGGHPYHAVAEAAAEAARVGNVLPDEVESIAISRPGFQGFANTHQPTDLIGIAHSALYFAACGVVDRDYTWAHAFPEKINDPVIRAMLGKVHMADPPTQDLDKYKSGAMVTITTRDGNRHTATVHAPRGAAVLGIAWHDIEAKYRALVPCAEVSGEHLESSFAVIRDFRNASGTSELVRLLR